MTTSIDERVVEMRFDNKQFEEGTKQTLSTLRRLKEALKFSDSSKSLNDFVKAANSIHLDGLINGVKTLEQRFSGLGIVGMRVIQNLTDSMMNTMGKAVNFVSDSIVSGGIRRSMNIENAHFQLQALLKDEEKVQEVMDNAMESVDGTAYAYDEAAKAASMFSASGIQAGEEMMRALKGITGVAAMTNSEYEGIAQIFTTVAGNGRIMGDELLQLSSRGLNAASTIADFFNQVNSGAVDTSDDVKAAITELTEGFEVNEKAIREWVSKGEISFNMFAEAMGNAFGDSAKRANETFTGALSNMKSALARIGAGFTSPLVVQNGALVELFNTMRERINDIKKELVFDESIGNVNALSKQFTDSVIGMAQAASAFIKDADITKGTEILYNNVEIIKHIITGLGTAIKPIGKAFKDTFEYFKIDNLVELTKRLADATKGLSVTEYGARAIYRAFRKIFSAVELVVDIFGAFYKQAAKISNTTKIFMTFNRILRSIMNVGQGVLGVVMALGRAFVNAFSGLRGVQLEDFLRLLREAATALMNFTAKLKLSDEASKNLEDGFTGLFNVVKLLIDVFVGLVSAIVPVNKPIVSLSGSLLSLFGFIGRVLTQFTEWVQSSKSVSTACNLIGSGISGLIGIASSLVKGIGSLVTAFYSLEPVQNFFEKIRDKIEDLDKNGAVYMTNLVTRVREFGDSLLDMAPDAVKDGFAAFVEILKKFKVEIQSIDFSSPSAAIASISKEFQKLIDLAKSNPAFNTFLTNIEKFIIDLKNGFSSDNVTTKVDGLMNVLGKFSSWIKETFVPALSDLSAGDALAAGTTFAGIYSLIKASKMFEPIMETFGGIPKLLDKLSGVLEGYEKNLHADTMLKIAKSIGILAASLIVLSFADTDKMLEGAKALALVGAVVVAGVFAIAKLKGKDKDVSGTLNQIAKVMTDFVKELGQSLLGNSAKRTIVAIGVTFVAITASILKVAKQFKKDKSSLYSALAIVGGVAAVFAALIAAFAIMSKKLDGATGQLFLTSAKGISFMATGILLCVQALTKLMKVKLPEDYGKKLLIFSGLFLGMAAVATVLSLVGKISGGKEAPYKSLIAMSASLILVVQALKKLFKMKLPDDWEVKVVLLMGIITAISGLMVVIALAARLSKGGLKAGGTLTGMATVIGAVVAALGVLGAIKGEKLLKGALALGAVLLALAVPISQAGKITDEGAGQAVEAMSKVIVVIAGALGVLSLLKWSALMKGVVAMDAVLVALALTFGQVGKIQNEKAYMSILSMVGVVALIAVALVKLSEQPWEGLLAATISISAVLAAFSLAFKQISKAGDVEIAALMNFYGLVIAVIPIAVALYMLSDQPWNGMIAAGAAMSLTILAFSKSFETIASANKVSIKTIGEFLLLTLALIPVGLAIYKLSEQPWDGMLAGAAAMSMTLLALSGVLFILEKVGKGGGASVKGALIGILLLDALIADLTVVLMALGALFQNETIKSFLNDGMTLLPLIGKSLGDFFGGIVEGFATGVASSFGAFGTGLTDFMTNAKGFFDGVKNIDKDSMEAIGYLTKGILMITGAELLQKIVGLETLVEFGKQLPEFGRYIVAFSNVVSGLDSASVEGAASAAEMMATVANKLPYADDTLLGKIFGRKSLAEFGAELESFGPHILAFAQCVNGRVDKKSVAGAAAAAQMMAEVANGLTYDPESLFGKLFGSKTLTEFGEELESFGPHILAFAQCVNGRVSKKSVSGAAAAAEMMAVVASKLPSGDATLVGKIFGKKNLSEFGTELEKFGPAIASFAESVSGVSEDAVKGATALANTMTAIANMLPNSGGFVSFFTGDNSIDKFGEMLKEFGYDLRELAFTLAEIGDGNIQSVAETIKTLVDVFDISGDDSVKAFLNAFKNSGKRVSEAVQKMINYGIDAIHNKDSAFNDKGADSMVAYTKGIASKQGDVQNSGRESVNNVATGINLSLASLTSAGENAGQGFVNGIMSKKSEAEAAGYALGNAAYEASRRALDEHSPSKKMGEVGAFGALGFIQQMMSYIPQAALAGEQLAESALAGAANGSAQLVHAIDSSWNPDPLITPRMDLSEIQSAGGVISKIFEDPIYSIRASAEQTNGTMNRMSVRQAETGVLSMLGELKDLIPGLQTGGDSYRIGEVSYSEGSEVAEAIKTLVRATKVKRRV